MLKWFGTVCVLGHNVNLMLTFSGTPLPSEVFTGPGASFPRAASPLHPWNYMYVEA